jgi:hypothetical protein
VLADKAQRDPSKVLGKETMSRSSLSFIGIATALLFVALPCAALSTRCNTQAWSEAATP